MNNLITMPKRGQKKLSFESWLLSQHKRRDAVGDVSRQFMALRMAYQEWDALANRRAPVIPWPSETRARRKAS
jgi:hypothetical protein